MKRSTRNRDVAQFQGFEESVQETSQAEDGERAAAFLHMIETKAARKQSSAVDLVEPQCESTVDPAEVQVKFGVKVLVTGASGYLASHVVQQLLKEGYTVRGTVRDLYDEKKIAHLHNLWPSANPPLELVEADLEDDECWKPAVAGMTYVIHTSSPYPLENPRDEMDLITPAVEGTVNVLKACGDSRSVKRVVLTSSCVAIDWSGTSESYRDESHWSDPSKQDAYNKSKTKAELAAWEFMQWARLWTGVPVRFELAVINPAMIMGPPLHGSSCASIEILKKLLLRSMIRLPKTCYPIVDVRDCATAHIRAMTVPGAAGKRHICSAGTMWLREIALLLKCVFGPQGYNIETREAYKWMLCIVSLCDKTARKVLPDHNLVRLYKNTRMRTVLEVEPRNLRDTIIDMAYACIEAGFIPKTPLYRGPGGPEEREMYLKVHLHS